MMLSFFSRIPSCCIPFLFLLFPIWSNAQGSRNENALLYGGNAFYWTDMQIDSTFVVDPETGETLLKIQEMEAAITRMNQEPVYNSMNYKETTPPVFEYNHQDEEKYLQSLFKYRNELKEAPSFSIRKMVISRAGKPVYFEIQFDDMSNTRILKQKWGSVIEKIIRNMPLWKPGTYKGYPVLFYLDTSINITNQED